MDKRKKACPNEKCVDYKKRKYNNNENVCPICGTNLVYVCKSVKCYKPIEDIGPKHCRCEECSAKREDTKDRIINKCKKTIIGAGTFVLAAFSSEITKKAKKIVKDTIHSIVNK